MIPLDEADKAMLRSMAIAGFSALAAAVANAVAEELKARWKAQREPKPEAES